MQPADLTSPLSDAELDELDGLLLKLESDTAILNVSELDGFLSAVVSGPAMVPPSKWLPAIWGDETRAPVWRDAKQFEHVFSLLIRHMNGILATLMQAPEDFEALFGERVVDGKPYLVVDEWCLGYMKGVALCVDAWHRIPEELVDELLEPIPLFSEEAGWRLLESLSDDEVRLLQDEIEPTVRAIHAYWLAQRSPASGTAAAATVRRETLKIRRNEPCPCGSGRKHKLCCGAH